MKRVSNISINISISDVEQAARKAFEGHSGKPEVEEFKSDFDKNCIKLYNALKDGSWPEMLAYRQLEKTNNNGKRRHIDCPSLVTRIYQILMMLKLEPVYRPKDNLNGLNCKKGCGITATDKRRSVLHRMKRVFYDRRDLHWYLVIDQRKCYGHITEKVARKALKRLTDDRWMVDFAVRVSFVKGRLPIGTPSSPFIHHVVMLGFDHWVRTLAPFSIRYADDNFLAFATKQEANAAKWRIKQYWWYMMDIRAKRHTVTLRGMDEPCDFCGYVFHRSRRAAGHGKGYVRLRGSIAKRARKCRDDKSWASYFGLMKHADCYRLMRKTEQTMKLKELTEKIRIDRKMDARHIDIKELCGIPFTIYDYEMRCNSQKEPNWIKCLVGIEEVKEGEKTGKTLAYEFHGNYQGIIQFIAACEKAYGKTAILPMEELEIENQCGYIFKGSTNQMTYIEENEELSNH